MRYWLFSPSYKEWKIVHGKVLKIGCGLKFYTEPLLRELYKPNSHNVYKLHLYKNE